MAQNNDKIYVNYRIRDKRKKINIFDKVNSIKQDIRQLIPEIEDNKLLPMLSHIRQFQYGKLHYGRRAIKENLSRKRELTSNEKIVYDYMLKNNLNPSTTYRWFIACRVPEDIREKLEQGKISQRKAIMIADNRKKAKMSNIGLLMIEEIKNIVGSL